MPTTSTTLPGDRTEPLVFAAGLDAIKNIVVDASLITADPSNANRRILVAGTLLKKSVGKSPTGKNQYIKYDGTGLIEGVLAVDTEVTDGFSNSDRTAGMFFHGCVFNAAGITDYSTYFASAISTLNTCKFMVP